MLSVTSSRSAGRRLAGGARRGAFVTSQHSPTMSGTPNAFSIASARSWPPPGSGRRLAGSTCQSCQPRAGTAARSPTAGGSRSSVIAHPNRQLWPRKPATPMPTSSSNGVISVVQTGDVEVDLRCHQWQAPQAPKMASPSLATRRRRANQDRVSRDSTAGAVASTSRRVQHHSPTSAPPPRNNAFRLAEELTIKRTDERQAVQEERARRIERRALNAPASTKLQAIDGESSSPAAAPSDHPPPPGNALGERHEIEGDPPVIGDEQPPITVTSRVNPSQTSARTGNASPCRSRTPSFEITQNKVVDRVEGDRPGQSERHR